MLSNGGAGGTGGAEPGGSGGEGGTGGNGGTGGQAPNAGTTNGGAGGTGGAAGEASGGTGGAPPVDKWWEEISHEEIYLIGLRQQGQCTPAMTRLLSPRTSIAGFTCDSDVSNVVHDGKILYNDNAGSVRQWVPDDSSMGYPAAPLDNDLFVPTQCPGEVTRRLVPGVDSAMLAYYCDTQEQWYDLVSDEMLLAGEADILAINEHGVGFTVLGQTWALTNLEDGTQQEWDPTIIVGQLMHVARIRRGTMRGHDDGFHFIVGDRGDWQLWAVTQDLETGALSTDMLGTYPPPPPNSEDSPRRVWLTADDVFYNGSVRLMRRSLDGSVSELLYVDSMEELKLDTAYMFAGK